jgi:hypothetical protein
LKSLQQRICGDLGMRGNMSSSYKVSILVE